MAPPVAGMCSIPVTFGRHSRCNSGPATTLDSWYCTRSLPTSVLRWLLKDNRLAGW